jgi:hypothetical protein
MSNADTYGNPRSPIITFRVAAGPDLVSYLHPDRCDNDQDRAISAAAHRASNVSVYLPGYLSGENVTKNHDGTFTAYGMKAKYMKDNYTTGTNPLLAIVSETFASA